MEYDYIILGEHFTNAIRNRIRKRYQGKVLLLEHMQVLADTSTRTRGVKNIRAVLLEVRKKDEDVQLRIMTKSKGVETVLAKNLIITSCGGISENKLISIYEVLWAAGVKLLDTSLVPIIDTNNSASMEGLYYIPEW